MKTLPAHKLLKTGFTSVPHPRGTFKTAIRTSFDTKPLTSTLTPHFHFCRGVTATMKHNGLGVRLRPCVENNTFMAEFGPGPELEGGPHHTPNASTFVVASSRQAFEVFVRLETSFMPHSAQVLTIEIEAKSALKRDSKENETQTWSIPLCRRRTGLKHNRDIDAESAKEYCFSTYVFWTRDKSPCKFSSASHPFLVPEVGECITVRFRRGKLLDIEPRLPMKENDTNPPRSPTETELAGPTIIDERWFKKLGGRNGKPIEFEFEICAEDFSSPTLQSKVMEARCGRSALEADDCDDDEGHVAIKPEEQPDLLEGLMRGRNETRTDQVQPASTDCSLKETDQDIRAKYGPPPTTDAGHCTLRPSNGRIVSAKYDTTYHILDDYIGPAPETSTTEVQAEMPMAMKKVGYSQFYPLDNNGQPIKSRGRPVGWRKAYHSREAHGLEPYTNSSTPKGDASRGHESPANVNRPLQGQLKDTDAPVGADPTASIRHAVANRKVLDQDHRSVLVRKASDRNEDTELSQEPSSDRTDSRAMKKAKLMLELEWDEVKVKQREISIRKKLLDLEERY